MAEYIDRKAVLQAMWNALYIVEEDQEAKHGLDPQERLATQCGFEAGQQIVANFPAADVKPVVRGTWEDVMGWLTCSVCGNTIYEIDDYGDRYPTNFCSNCGADMRKEDGGNGKG